MVLKNMSSGFIITHESTPEEIVALFRQTIASIAQRAEKKEVTVFWNALKIVTEDPTDDHATEQVITVRVPVIHE